MRKEGGWLWYHSKLFTLRFSNKFVLAPSCKRPKTTQRTLFLSFESNNCFPITIRLKKKSGKHAFHMENSNIAIGSLPTLQTSHGFLALFEKIYYGKPIFTDFSNIGEDCTIPFFQLSLRCEKCAAAGRNSVIGNQLLYANNRNRVC